MADTADRIWVEGDLVFHQGPDGVIAVRTAEVSIRLSRLLGAAAGDALMNRHRRTGRGESGAGRAQ